MGTIFLVYIAGQYNLGQPLCTCIAQLSLSANKEPNFTEIFSDSITIVIWSSSYILDNSTANPYRNDKVVTTLVLWSRPPPKHQTS